MIDVVQPKHVHTERNRAESFGSVAEQYERFRPSYPSALIDLAALEPLDVLDVGCGTGKAGRLLAERGLHVLGVEIDEEMANVARRHELAVEVAPFERWDAGSRRFDLIVCGQTWHWVNPTGYRRPRPSCGPAVPSPCSGTPVDSASTSSVSLTVPTAATRWALPGLPSRQVHPSRLMPETSTAAGFSSPLASRRIRGRRRTPAQPGYSSFKRTVTS